MEKKTWENEVVELERMGFGFGSEMKTTELLVS